MAVSKVIFGNTTVMDITDSTVTASKLKSGETAYGADGTKITGSLVVPDVLDDLSDVVITTPQTAQEIYFDGTNWINYGAKIVLTFDDDFKGQTITLAKGQTTITKTAPLNSNTMNLYVNETGLWTISSTISGDTYETEVNVTTFGTSFNAELSSVPPIPEGATVTPTDDIQTWLACANITDKSYTTLAEVLADRETFEILISDSNACDYMARSTTWASDTTDDADAMALIGKYDYCSNALLGNSVWAEAIANSDYFEEVLNVKVPVMTSNTTPSGECFGSSIFNTSTDFYKAFDNNDSTSWNSTVAGSIGSTVGYDFGKPTVINKVRIYATNTLNNPTNVTIQGYDTEWHDITTFDRSTLDTTNTFNNNTAYTKYRVKVNTFGGTTGTNTAGINTLQFYGRESSEVQTNIVHSCANDTIYYMDNGSPIIVATTNSDGDGILDFSSLEDKEYTFYSSVAKDPSNLSNDFSKTIRITKSEFGGTTEMYLMPDTVKTLYWWGYRGEELTSSGWTYANISTPQNAPTYNTTDVTLTCNNNGNSASFVGTSNTKHLTKVNAIGYCTSTGSALGRVSVGSTKDASSQAFGTLPLNTIGLASYTATEGDYYIGISTYYVTTQSKFNAVWYE